MMEYFKYWGKARKRADGGWDCHLLPYHCLDVAAVGMEWLAQDSALRMHIARSVGMDRDDPHLDGLVGFFLSLHDFGKFDIRFQSKVPALRDRLWSSLDKNDLLLTPAHIMEFDHGKVGYDLFVKFYAQLLGLNERDENILDQWKPWVAAVTGHHGVIPNSAEWHKPNVEERVMDHDQQARVEWFKFLITLFLNHGQDSVPSVPELFQAGSAIVAGFCSVSDWIASNELFVRWIAEPGMPDLYFEKAKKHCRNIEIMQKAGLVGCRPAKYSGVKAVLNGNKPRQIQMLIDNMPPDAGLSIIECPTGSGKTEAALALAWKLIDAGRADSIVFALPTQATADAMLERLQNLASVLFADGTANLVLAHGKAKYNPVFANLKTAGRRGADQQGDLGAVQCAEWISSSRKRIFLGQIGICTIDQALLSVLPVRHNFVRSFGLMKSVLIIDEVHAYDRYMYGLLEEMLKRQKAAGGSAILLSATLPAVQKQELFEAWHQGAGAGIAPDAPYPSIGVISEAGKNFIRALPIDEMPPNRVVRVDLVATPHMIPDEEAINRAFAAEKKGAAVAIVCNLVQHAQETARRLRAMALGSACQIDIFHARYRFKDRQVKELAAKNTYGKDASRICGRILVATQVVEQSLDLDFDWLITQLCPVDLLFQRLGRLHRHNRNRPEGFKEPRCTLLSKDGDDFGVHEKVYGDARILWRTREMLKQCEGTICFPQAYRKWIEIVYGRKAWQGGDEPDAVIGKSQAFRQEQQQLWYEARSRATDGMRPFADTEKNTLSLTRGSQMALNLVPVQDGRSGRVLLDGEALDEVNEFERDELFNLNSIPVPAGWKKGLPPFEDGYIFLPMRREGDAWIWNHLKYTSDFGLENQKQPNESAD